MRKTMMLIAIPVAAVGVAVAVVASKSGKGANPNDKFATDLQTAQAAGLDLAQAQGAKKYALTEIAPDSKPQPDKKITQGNGTKAIRSKTPTVKAAPEPVAAETVEEIPQTVVTETAAPTPAEIPVPAVPRPVPQTSGTEGPILAGGTARGGNGSGGGIGMGGIFGAIIRGGGVDGDNCDPRPSGSNRRPTGQPVYVPNSGRPIGGIVGGRVVLQPRAPAQTPAHTVFGAKPRGGPR
jgi:hypothetical protein